MFTIEIGFHGELMGLVGVFPTADIAIAAANVELDTCGEGARSWYQARVRRWRGFHPTTVWESVLEPLPAEEFEPA